MTDKLHLARLKAGGHNFEIVIDPDMAMKYKKGSLENVREAVVSEQVFHDAKKGDLASENLMKSMFGTDSALEVIKKIISDGEIQLTAEYREKEREDKKKQIINIIHRYSVDPKTGIPHPAERIKNAMREAKAGIDENKTADDQVQDIISKLRPILPIKFEIKEIQVHLKAEHAAKAYGTVSKLGRLMKDEWLNDGSWLGVLEVPAGLEPDLYDKLNAVTHGEAETKVLSK